MLFIFVEGPDDRNYFEAVFGKQGAVKIYAQNCLQAPAE